MPKKLNEFNKLEKRPETVAATTTTNSYAASAAENSTQLYMIKSCSITGKAPTEPKMRYYFTNEYVAAPLYTLLLGEAGTPEIDIVENDTDLDKAYLSSKFLTNFTSLHAFMKANSRNDLNKIQDVSKVFIAMLVLGENDLNPENTGIVKVGDQKYGFAKIDHGQSMTCVYNSWYDLLARLQNIQQVFKVTFNIEQTKTAIDQMIKMFNEHEIEEVIRLRVDELQKIGFVWNEKGVADYTLCGYNGRDNKKTITSIERPEDLIAFYIKNLTTNLRSLKAVSRVLGEVIKQIEKGKYCKSDQKWQDIGWLESIQKLDLKNDCTNKRLESDVEDWSEELEEKMSEASVEQPVSTRPGSKSGSGE